MDRTVPKGAALLLAFVYETETSKAPPECYDVIFGHRQSKLAKPLTKMTLEEVQTAQHYWSTKKWASRFGSSKASSAAGAPQFMRATLEELIDQLGLRGSQTFDSDLQDRLAYNLLIRRGYHQFVNGEIDRTEFGRRLAQEWASFPVLEATKGAHRHIPRGVSYYEGDSLNKALVAPETVEALLDRVYATANSTVSMPAPRPEPKPEPVAKSKRFWTWLLTGIGTPLAAFGALDWRVQLAVVAVITGLAIYAITSMFGFSLAAWLRVGAVLAATGTLRPGHTSMPTSKAARRYCNACNLTASPSCKMEGRSMRKSYALMTLACVPFLAAASCQTTDLIEPCDVLVRIDPKPATNTFLVANDKQAAIAIAQHRGRYQNYSCGQ